MILRVLMDNNVWAWIADADASAELLALEDASGVDIVTSPGVLMEMLATPNPDALGRLVATLCARQRTRLRTEVRLECEEVVDAFRSLRPEWMLKRPRVDRVHTLDRFWGERLWIEARRDPVAARRRHLAAMRMSDPTGELVQDLLSHERDQRKALLEALGGAANDAEGMVDKTIVPAVLDPHSPSQLGWGSGPLSAWRVFSALYWWEALVRTPIRSQRTGQDTTEWDWAGPYLNGRALAESRQRFNEFWYHEVSQAEVPRAWIRVNARSAQSAMKITSGNPWDESLCVHLVDVDLFVTGDARLARVAEALRLKAPVELAEVRVLTTPDAPVQELAECLI